MFRKQVSPRAVALAIILILAGVQLIYWRLLVYTPTAPAPPGPGGGGAGPLQEVALGLEGINVEVFVGAQPGYEDGPAWKARFSGPNALALESPGTLLLADSRNHRIRRVTPAGGVTTVAGGGDPGGRGGCTVGPALEARLRFPSGVAAAPDGTIYVADTGNHRICRLWNGQVELLAGSADGQQAGMQDGTGAQARFRAPGALCIGPDGALWVLDAGNSKVRRIDTAGTVTSPAGVPEAVRNALGDSTDLPPTRTISAWKTIGDPEPTGFRLGRRAAATAAPGAPQIFADSEHGSVYIRLPGHESTLLAGRRPDLPMSDLDSDGPGNRVTFAVPSATATAADGTVYVAEYEANRVRRLRVPEWLLGGSIEQPEMRGGRWRRGGRGS